MEQNLTSTARRKAGVSNKSVRSEKRGLLTQEQTNTLTSSWTWQTNAIRIDDPDCTSCEDRGIHLVFIAIFRLAVRVLLEIETIQNGHTPGIPWTIGGVDCRFQNRIESVFTGRRRQSLEPIQRSIPDG